MTALDTLRVAGLAVTVTDGQWLDVGPALLLTDDLRGFIRGNKAAILAELAGAQAPWEDAPAPSIVPVAINAPASQTEFLPDEINLTEWAYGAHPGVQIGELVGATGKPWIGGKAYTEFVRAS
jgi:hypothetical protein